MTTLTRLKELCAKSKGRVVFCHEGGLHEGPTVQAIAQMIAVIEAGQRTREQLPDGDIITLAALGAVDAFDAEMKKLKKLCK